MALQKTNKKVALITGGSGGIGSELVRCLAAKGISVVFTYLSSEKEANEIVASIRANKGEVNAIRADISKLDDITAIYHFIQEQYGQFDYLINNAGMIMPGPIEDITNELYEKIFNINVRGALFILKEATPFLRKGGSIINISSTMVGIPIAGSALYAASKAALELFSRVLSKEMGPRDITVNSLRLGATIPGMFAKAPPERQAAFAAASPFNRLGTPHDVANIVTFLLSDGGRWITGQTITVDGGAT